MKKIKDFLPEECQRDYDKMIEFLVIELNHTQAVVESWWDEPTINEEMLRKTFSDWLNTETTAELEGVEPDKKITAVHMNGNHSYTCKCGNCDNPISLSKNCDFFCRKCGTKINWSGVE